MSKPDSINYSLLAIAFSVFALIISSTIACPSAPEVETDRNNPFSPTCGNGEVEEGEDCDDGNTLNFDSCSSSCLIPKCGDGQVNQNSEQCDDGNSVNTDSCTNDCKAAICGDGITQSGEECDDGDTLNANNCTTSCMTARCGDGYIQGWRGEECDDANEINTDSCTNDCQQAICGDNITQTGEGCDDGNQNDNDDCTNACQTARCGDGIVHDGNEECDDPTANNGHCFECKVETNWVRCKHSSSGTIRCNWRACNSPFVQVCSRSNPCHFSFDLPTRQPLHGIQRMLAKNNFTFTDCSSDQITLFSEYQSSADSVNVADMTNTYLNARISHYGCRRSDGIPVCRLHNSQVVVGKICYDSESMINDTKAYSTAAECANDLTVKRFRAFDGRKTYEQAKVACQNIDGSLATVTTSKERAEAIIAWGLIQSSDLESWIGLKYTNDGWEWNNGDKFSADNNYFELDSNDLSGNGCGYVSWNFFTGFKWVLRSSNCAHRKNHYLCEYYSPIFLN